MNGRPEELPESCHVRDAVEEFIRVFQLPPGSLEVYAVANAVLHVRVRTAVKDAKEEDLMRSRICEHLRLRFPFIRGTVVQFARPEGGAARS